MIKDTENNVFLDLEKVPLRSERQERRQKRLRNFLIVLMCIFFFAMGTIFGYFLIKSVHPSYKADTKNTMGEIEYILDHYWLYSSDYDDLTTELENKALYGMTNFADDPYTSYMSSEEMEEFSNSINMNYVGIGVQYSYVNGIALINKVFKDSPAEKAGVLAGDIMKAVDGISLEDKTSDDIKEMVIGEEGTDVVLSVLRGGEIIDITITRGEVDSTVYAYKENDYVVLEINSFGVDSGDRCITYLDQYTDLHKIIIDLRDNSGGYQSSVKDISGLFIGDNKIYLREKDSKGVETVDTTSAKKVYDNFTDYVVLVNENTASAAEVLAICLREQLKNVILIGTTTYGKGVIQTNRLLNNDGVLKLTAYYWYSPNGVSIDKVGIVPDIEVRDHDIYYEYYYQFADDEQYAYDCVAEAVRTSELGLDFLDYDVDRTDGYFDRSFETALIEFQRKNGLEPDGILNGRTYEAIVSEVNREMANNKDKDLQMKKAKEILNANYY
ncbi:MAG: peptidoglycan-binding protein [Erysipelotrichaceae bacterium]|nr:peptidoglycan-binding protein [Erysipelotrichaceae bacterium]